jgi:diacylglycerol kinase family enzyme
VDLPAQLPRSADQVLVSVNPVAGAGRARHTIQRLVERLERHGLSVEILNDLDIVTSRVAELQSQQRLRALVCAGGDGTVAELLNRTEPGVPMAILPLGTENLLERYLRRDRDQLPLDESIVAGKTHWLDVGRANGRLFTLMASCGFDAEVVRRLHSARRGNITHLAYVRPILEAIRSYQYPLLRVYCGEEGSDTRVPSTMIEARWAFLFNLPSYARGLPIAPEAVATDGLLDLCTFQRGSLLSGLGYLWSVTRRRHSLRHDCHTRRVTTARIESDSPVPYQLDGDLGGMLPLEIQMVPRRLRILATRRDSMPGDETTARDNTAAHDTAMFRENTAPENISTARDITVGNDNTALESNAARKISTRSTITNTSAKDAQAL